MKIATTKLALTNAINKPSTAAKARGRANMISITNVIIVPMTSTPPTK